MLRGLRLAKTVALIVADYKLRDLPLWGEGGGGDKRMSKEAEAALVQAETGKRAVWWYIACSSARKSNHLRPPTYCPSTKPDTDLREAQNEYEALSYALRALDEEGLPQAGERARLEAKAKAARGLLLAAAARVARVEEHAQVFFFVWGLGWCGVIWSGSGLIVIIRCLPFV